VSVAQPTIGSGPYAIGTRGPRVLAAPATSDYSSFCLMCASWYFYQHLPQCSKCHSDIFRWVTSDDLRFFRSRSSLGSM
jgi:hypothetical protein